ncbi:AAA-ATPase-like domain-containing protein, partial [Trichophaea hybrida]
MANPQAYFDRTRYITTIDSCDDVLLFLRPRRFGKSITLSMLHYFHGVEHKKHYAKAFKDLDVDKDVQDKKIFPNQYLVLVLDFSAVRQSTNNTYAIDEMINIAVKKFYNRYAPFLGKRTSSELVYQLINPANACVSLQNCVELVSSTLQEVIDQDKQDHPLAGVKGVGADCLFWSIANIIQIYVLIDEYDSFSNAHININPTSPNWNAMYPAGIIRSFYATMKSCTRPLQLVKYFITGVSPVALADVSSGFNIERNVTFLNALSGLCGLTREDVKAALGKLPSHDSADSVKKELSHL